MSNTSSSFKKASPLTFHPHSLLSLPQMAMRCTVEEIKMIVCWQKQGHSSFHPCRQQKWHHVSQTDTLINLVSPELFWKREPFTPASYLVSAIIGFCILPCSIYDGRITFWALTSWQGFILLPLLMTSPLQVNCRCNDFLFCFWILLKCHHDPRHLNLA